MDLLLAPMAAPMELDSPICEFEVWKSSVLQQAFYTDTLTLSLQRI
jgi:hypothetical protein